MTEETGKPIVTLRYVFNVCNDVAAMRSFYVELLGMQEAAFMDTPEFGWLSIQCEGLQMMWFRADAEVPVAGDFACQPGWAGGVLEVASFAIAVPEDRFVRVLERLREAGARLFRPEPEWRQESYWGLSVLDPMGVTLEVYTAPREKPASTVWPAG